MQTILITGINGFLGSNIAKYLSDKYQVIGLEYSTQNLFRLTGYSFEVFASTDNPEDIFKRYEIYAVLHVATVYRRHGEPVNKLISTNIQLPVDLYELADKYGTKMFINTDSFFNNPNYQYKYLGDYTLSKRHAADWLKLINKRCKTINLKLFHMYGAGDAPDKFLPKLFSDIKMNKQLIELTPGEQVRDFVYVEDVAAAYKVVLESYESLAEGFSEFEVGTGTPTSVNQLVLLIAACSGSTSTFNFGALPYRENEIMHAVANIEPIASLGWEPRYSLKEGITAMLNIS
ncbi:NAD-dependent epimerase/dehydratase family protein [Hufsiella ginkgonis]|uniref:NAD-dependent epimerase/dehydratase family protein n=1 Tax=Hufsiella ginkgonis TaxID=2695274 RepID=A0A7K1Y2W5_9SPHI|nr:NAD-dependent epimerase/dehydratase [Hufsiella ginkgonis]MXV17428.1 NAD-dependent epimerase/dehydratase family protein [Hufsiella ginkgonis]